MLKLREQTIDAKKERWGKLLNLLAITQREFAERAGIPQGNLSWMIHGKLGLSIANRRKITEAFPQVNLEWIETGQGEPLIAA